MQLLEWLEDEENLEDAAVKDTLDGIEGAIEDKADNYAKIIKELKAEAKKFAEEKKRLEERQQAMENRGIVLKYRLHRQRICASLQYFSTNIKPL